MRNNNRVEILFGIGYAYLDFKFLGTYFVKNFILVYLPLDEFITSLIAFCLMTK